MTHRHVLLCSALGTMVVGVGGCQVNSRPVATADEVATPALSEFGATRGLADGTLTRTEFVAAVDNSYYRIDGDADDRVFQAEFANFAARNRGASSLSGSSQDDFQRADLDNDGFISREEFRAKADREFGRFDTDRDGAVTQSEATRVIRGLRGSASDG